MAPELTLLYDFLVRHGHRRSAEPILLMLRWCEVRKAVIELLAHYVSAAEQFNQLEVEACQRAERKALSVQIAGRLDPLRRRIFLFCLATGSIH